MNPLRVWWFMNHSLPPDVQAQQRDGNVAHEQPRKGELHRQLGVHRVTLISLIWVVFMRAIIDHSSDWLG